MFRWVEEQEQKARERGEVEEEDDDIEYDRDGNPIRKKKVFFDIFID